jgi:hypothetical protein
MHLTPNRFVVSLLSIQSAPIYERESKTDGEEQANGNNYTQRPRDILAR